MNSKFEWDREYSRKSTTKIGSREWTLEIDSLRIDINDYKENGKIIYKWYIFDNYTDSTLDNSKTVILDVDIAKEESLLSALNIISKKVSLMKKDIKFLTKFKNIVYIKEKLL